MRPPPTSRRSTSASASGSLPSSRSSRSPAEAPFPSRPRRPARWPLSRRRAAVPDPWPAPCRRRRPAPASGSGSGSGSDSGSGSGAGARARRETLTLPAPAETPPASRRTKRVREHAGAEDFRARRASGHELRAGGDAGNGANHPRCVANTPGPAPPSCGVRLYVPGRDHRCGVHRHVPRGRARRRRGRVQRWAAQCRASRRPPRGAGAAPWLCWSARWCSCWGSSCRPW